MGVLTTEERKVIGDSWELVKPNMQRHGAQFFILLFSEMPHLQIKHFSQMDVNDLFRLTEHGLKVFRGVNGFINAVNSDNDDQLVQRIQRITRSHFDRGIIAKEDFECVCELLLKYLGSQLGNNLSADGAKAWKKLLDTLVIVVAAEQEKIVAEIDD